MKRFEIQFTDRDRHAKRIHADHADYDPQMHMLRFRASEALDSAITYSVDRNSVLSIEVIPETA